MNNNNYYNYKKKVKPLYSLPVIIIFMIVFWPFGLYLIYKRININKKIGFAKGIAYFCFFMDAAVILVMLTSSNAEISDIIPPAILLFLIGLAELRLSKKNVLKVERYEKYISIITSEKEYIIDNLASYMSLPTHVVRKDLNDMIDNGYLQGAYINNSTNEIVLPQQSKENIYETTSNNSEPKAEEKVITCKCCGAQNKVTTNARECEYCGSPL